MKKTTRIITVLSISVLLGIYGLVVYNSLVTKEENVKTAWGQVESQYQRRLDLIPNLVATVETYAQYEQKTLQKVIEARAKATQITIVPENITSESLQKFQQIQNNLATALSKLMIAVERYPDLKANKNFLILQAQLEGTENRIAYERKRFNGTVKNYNTYCRIFPNNIFAKIIGFTAKDYFKADKGANKGVELKFNK